MFTDKETKQLCTNNRRMRPKQPQPGFQRPRLSDTKPARICDPKSIRPRYETVTGNGYPRKGRKIKQKTDKTKHGMEKRGKDK
ncbi:hypothetical protein Tco_0934559, partial [Tanacetum coccineum]